ncbi:hypothetical protein G4X40_18665 [Rhodococcus sp. D2-41]|uniref:hypothetical protein n=1 Tax=Speluncibacter jeojiensis TaxID=2710754 RepID=UPI00240F1ADD|nr:hypothetical protein [Rhodococcus sp. D2-41]MDG3012168.1 hypothetical protein [Rhodococcus sp. D2-41]
MAAHTITLPWTTPMLSLNGRDHYRVKAKKVAQIRHDVATLIRERQIEPAGHVRVELHYRPRDNRRRDEDNLVGDLKAICDGLVDAGLVPDDTPEWMSKIMPILHRAERGVGSQMWLAVDCSPIVP